MCVRTYVRTWELLAPPTNGSTYVRTYYTYVRTYVRSRARLNAHAVEMAAEKSVKLSQLSLQQLDRIKAQLNEVSINLSCPEFTTTPSSRSRRTIFYLVLLILQEVNILTSSMQSLKTVQLKLKESKQSLDSINEKSQGKKSPHIRDNICVFFFFFYRKAYSCSINKFCILHHNNSFYHLFFNSRVGVFLTLGYSQMYVPGRLKGTAKVLVDIGTGFYVEKVIQ